MDDVYASGWKKVEAALTDDVFAERTELTEQLLAENEAAYTVQENGTVYFFITDLFGNEHIEEYEVRCFDFDGPIIYAGVSGELLHVETYDLCTAVTGIYVNDMLYTTLENGVLDLWIAGNTWDRQLKVYSVDEIGNCSELLKIANSFYVEPVEETPVPTPDSEEPTHDAYCPADCDCRKQPVARAHPEAATPPVQAVAAQQQNPQPPKRPNRRIRLLHLNRSLLKKAPVLRKTAAPLPATCSMTSTPTSSLSPWKPGTDIRSIW